MKRTKTVRGGGNNNDGVCSICHEDLYKNETPKIYLFLLDSCTECVKCKNVVHKKCIKQWFRTNNEETCPSCRSEDGFHKVTPNENDNISAENLNQRNEVGFTALSLACARSLDTVAMQILNDYPLLVNINAVTDSGFTAIMYACLYELDNLAMELLRNADTMNLWSIDQAGETALTIACQKGLNAVALRILDYSNRANIGAVTTFYRKTALLHACERGVDDVVMKLLQHAPSANIGMMDTNGCTALILACMQGKRNIALKLLQYPEMVNMGAISKKQGPGGGRTALMIACEKGIEDVAMRMLEYPNHANIGAVNTRGDTALMIALKESHLSSSKKKIALHILLQHPKDANIDAVDKIARDRGLNEIVKIIHGMKTQIGEKKCKKTVKNVSSASTGLPER